MDGGTPTSSISDPGLLALVMLLRFQGVGADPEQIDHQFGGIPIGVPEMLRCARGFGLKARSLTTKWERLAGMPLPAIAALRDGSFLLLGKAGDDKIIVQAPLSLRSTLMVRAEFEAIWDGRLVLMTRRAALTDLARRFDITWFIGAVHKYGVRATGGQKWHHDNRWCH
jgi:subfamily B ATP-binding cassette protein HlyB/CyaB